MKPISVLVLFCTIAWPSVPGLLQAAPPSGLPLASDENNAAVVNGLQQITDLLQQHVDDGRIAGAVAGVARNGEVLYLESVGWQDVDGEMPMQQSSIFQIRSMSKPVTAMAALQLIEQGKLGLQDPVSDYIPRFGYMFVYIDPDEPFLSAQRKPARAITVEDLLLNTAGLSHRNSVLYRQRQVRLRSDSLEVLVDKVAGIPLIGDPGEQWVYSISITVLGRIIEIVSGQELDDYLAEHVFEPLQMEDTGFYVPTGKVDRLARGYVAATEDQALTLIEEMEVPITEDPPLLEGAAGMVSTVPDYLRFLQSLLNLGELDGARVLSQQSVQEMTRNQIDEALFPFGTNPSSPMLDRGWGYGLAVVIDSSKSAFGVNNGEFGWNGSLGTFSWADPLTGSVAILMLQQQPANAHGLSGKFKDIVYNSVSQGE